MNQPPDRRPDGEMPHRAFYAGRRVLVTGGLGFIGSNLSRELVELGARVTIVDALIPDHGGNLFNIQGIENDVQLDVADVRDSIAADESQSARDEHAPAGVEGAVRHFSIRTAVRRLVHGRILPDGCGAP